MLHAEERPAVPRLLKKRHLRAASTIQHYRITHFNSNFDGFTKR